LASFKKLTFTTSQGSIYLIDFTLLEINPLVDEIDVYDLLLKQESYNGQQNYEVLNFLGNEVPAFLEKNDGIIYFYCDNSEIKKNTRNAHLSNQEFRNRLFSAMFERRKVNARINGNAFDFVLRNIQIKDPVNGDHFISLISKMNQLESLQKLADEMLSIGDK